MNEFFDALETREPGERERNCMLRLARQVAHAKSRAPAYARLLAGVEPEDVSHRAALARLPVVRKSDLAGLQRENPPLGGFAANGWGAIGRVFQSPGPIYEPEGRSGDYWRIGRALFAAGFRSGELVHNAFSYHFTPAGSMLESAAHACGCTVFPAGTGQTEQQVQAIRDLRPAGYTGTPSFLRIILEKATEMNVDVGSITKAVVSGEAFLPVVRDFLASRGIDGYQIYATADLGNIAYETPAREGLVVDEGVLVEIVRPGTGEVLPDGEVGEVVVTTLTNTDYPLIRFGTGDLSAVLPGRSPCGRTNVRIRGWMGRADQTTKVKGMFVHPSQVADIVRRHPAVTRARLVVENPGGIDRMTLHCESTGADEGLDASIRETIREVTRLRGEVNLRQPGELPNDGKVIEDLRRYT